MRVQIIAEAGYVPAIAGIGLSYSKVDAFNVISYQLDGLEENIIQFEKLEERSMSLAGRGLGHDKFLRMIVVYIAISAPLYWWKQFDTYKVGTVVQSESTMHTLMCCSHYASNV